MTYTDVIYTEILTNQRHWLRRQLDFFKKAYL